jgi:hypothetical protein
MKRKWVRTTIAEPFPVFYSHTSQSCRIANDPRTEGPYYAAGAEFFDLEHNLEYRQRCAAALRLDGYSVTVDVVTR